MDKYFVKIKDKGYKLTPRRRAIIEIFASNNTNLTAEEVWKSLRKIISHCGLPGVYRNLESLVSCGILTRIQNPDCKKHYALCDAASHHHHIICIVCGKVDDINICPVSGVKSINGYKVVNHFMQVNGICPECAGNFKGNKVKKAV
jgi:Fur family transcriptional regulator, ferric uptake regulator